MSYSMMAAIFIAWIAFGLVFQLLRGNLGGLFFGYQYSLAKPTGLALVQFCILLLVTIALWPIDKYALSVAIWIGEKLRFEGFK